jgi:hypothetical protein
MDVVVAQHFRHFNHTHGGTIIFEIAKIGD